EFDFEIVGHGLAPTEFLFLQYRNTLLLSCPLASLLRSFSFINRAVLRCREDSTRERVSRRISLAISTFLCCWASFKNLRLLTLVFARISLMSSRSLKLRSTGRVALIIRSFDKMSCSGGW